MSDTHPTRDATIDLARVDRCWFPEVVFGTVNSPVTIV